MSLDLSQIASTLTAIGTIAGTAYATLPLFLWSKKLNLDSLHTVATVCQQVVAGIEQTQSSQSGAVKKQLALSAVETILTSLKVTVPDPFIEAAVEAAVLALGSNPATSPTPASSSAETPAAVSAPLTGGSPSPAGHPGSGQ